MIACITIYVAGVYLQHKKYFRPELGDIMHASTAVVVLFYCIWQHVLLGGMQGWSVQLYSTWYILLWFPVLFHLEIPQ